MLQKHYQYLYQKTESTIKQLEREVKQFPKEDICTSRSGKYWKYYICNGKNPIYIPRKNRPFAQLLALKKYKMRKLQEEKKELKILKYALSSYLDTDISADALMHSDSPYYPLLHEVFSKSMQKEITSFSQAELWQTAEYEHNPKHPEHLIHKTLAGHLVRSKSEVMIANALYMHKIPYRYECALSLGRYTIHPDFTIMHPYTHHIIYWEHYGMMDKEKYIYSRIDDLKDYLRNDIIPTINLITTFETLAHPIDSNEVEEIIQKYFL